ncbi:MAG: prolipoprotein diacylglyceryl transferase [Chloroflexi bacterium]|nr:prolipoprotein diacylglyceryl transferase [Chloroflexota bacterium]MBU1747076.1 prolipoprotein diacylglyceryl transferase [Chloroflexota bacterium]
MITISIDPILMHLGSIALTWHGILAALGVAVGFAVALWEAKRLGISSDDVYTAAILAIPAGFIGARLFHVADNLELYLANPMLLLSFQEAGMALYGAFLGGLVAILAYVWYKKYSVWQAVDAAALGILVGDAVGRLACTVNGDAYGIPTDLPWGFIYTHPGSFVPPAWRGIPTHPYPVYEIILCLLLAAVLFFLRTRIQVKGLLFLLAMGGFAFVRFFISFVRDNLIIVQVVKTDTIDIGLNEAQLISMLIVVVLVPLGLYLWRRGPRYDTLAPVVET